MTKNTLNDLNNHLFAELERLGDEDLPEDKLDKEIQRSNAILKSLLISSKTLMYHSKDIQCIKNTWMIKECRK